MVWSGLVFLFTILLIVNIVMVFRFFLGFCGVSEKHLQQCFHCHARLWKTAI